MNFFIQTLQVWWCLLLLFVNVLNASLLRGNNEDTVKTTTSTALNLNVVNLGKAVTNEIPVEYGVDVSFPIHYNGVSTNYPWLPHNTNPNIPVPHQYKDMPLQPLGDRSNEYLRYLNGCIAKFGNQGKRCANNEYDRIAMSLRQPQSMTNYTSVGYKKIKAPPEIFRLLKEFWDANNNRKTLENWGIGNTYTNNWESPTYMVSVENTNLRGGGPAFKQHLWDLARDTIQEWTGQELTQCSLYGIRVYTEGSILATHVDRLPLVSSAIINVAQDLDEPWPIEVYGHDGKATNVTMEPGDMVLYESHSVLHGRPFPLKGRYYANIFVHFEPVGHSLRHKEKMEQQKRDASEIHNNEGGKETLAFPGNAKLPPYILPGTPEEAHWRLLHPTGPVTKKVVAAAAAAAGLAAAVGKTTAVNPISQPQINQTTTIMTKNKKASNIHFAAQIGDLTTIQRAVEKDKSILGVTDANGWTPLHESARAGHKEIVRYLFEAGADINAKTDGGSGGTVMWLAKQSLGEDHELISYLESLGALDAGPDL